MTIFSITMRSFPLSFLIVQQSFSFQSPSPPADFLARVSRRGAILASSPFNLRSCYDQGPSYSFLSKPSHLFSLQKLVEDIVESSRDRTYRNGSDPRIVFVGGKGGVGKTSISSAIAVDLASSFESDIKVLIVSTDPAHSLGDALDVDLESGGEAVMLTDSLTGGKLYGCEVDPAAALASFRASLEAFDIDKLAASLGVSTSLLESLGLREFSGLLKNPPPGLDELVALSNVLDNTSQNSITAGVDVVIVDTAPTGHTLRMLALPTFLDGLLGKLIQLRMKFSGISSTLQAMLGSDDAAARAKTIDDAMGKLEEFRSKLSRLMARLHDSDKTSFLVVTIPTSLGVAESERLMKELASQGISVSDVVVNLCVGRIEGGDPKTEREAMRNYYTRRKAGQTKWIAELQQSIEDVSASNEYKANGESGRIALIEVPFFDVELVGVPGLTYVGNANFSENPSFSYLMNHAGEPKFIICGGKGGVGKTTTSSALAVSMAIAGLKVALVSTDPAHSLGDALEMDLRGGSMVEVPLVGASNDGSLSVMEVDPTAALGQFKTLVDSLINTPKDVNASSEGLRNTLRDLGEIFDTLPAGTDEVVALAKIIGLLKNGNYDRIVLDTAPTGHTVRMLGTPGFIAEFIDRVLAVAQKVNSNPTVKLLLSGAAKGQNVNEAAEIAKSTLLAFQLQMYDLEDLFSNASQTEFVIVTVATELAVRETVRLLNELTFEAPDYPIKVRNVVVNQVLREDGNDAKEFVERVRTVQLKSLKRLSSSLKSMKMDVEVTECPYLDTEPKGVFGLKALAAELVKDKVTSKA